MIFISILSLIVAKALPSLNINLPSVYFIRISAIIFIYAGVLSFNTLYIQSIGSGIGIYSGLFQVTVISHYIEVFLLLIGFLILIAWPLSTTKNHLSFNQTDRVQPSLSEVFPLPYLSEGYLSNSRGELVGVEGVQSNGGGKTGEGSTAIKDSEINKALQFIVADKTSQINQSLRGGKDYSLIVLFSTLGSCLLISSSDLVSMYLSIELQSFGLYVLATLYRDSESSTSAGLKYFLLGGLSSCLILLGSGLIYAFTGLTQFESIYSLISVLDVNNITQGLSLGLILIFVGFLFKIAAAPLHNWSPDVYDDTPTIVTIWLTIMPKIAILILLLEIYTQSSPGFLGIDGVSFYGEDLNVTLNYLNLEALQLKENSISLLKSLLLISSLLSLIIGTVVGLAQTRIKRLLAYSTISHIGFILLALAINTEQSIDSLIFYIIQYSISNLNIFLILIALSYIFMNTSPTYPSYDSSVTSHLVKQAPLSNIAEGQSEGVDRREGNLRTERLTLGVANVIGNMEGSTILKGDTGKLEVNTNKNSIDIRYISELKGQFLLNPLLSLSLAICLFSMAGIPPLIGFFSKQFVLYSALGSGYYFMSFVCIIVSVISASYYLKIIKVLYSSDSDTLKGTTRRVKQAPTPTMDSFPIRAMGEGQGETITHPLSKLGSEGQNVQTEFNNTNLSNFHSFLISTLTLFILLFLFKPSLILNSTKLLSLSLFYN